MDLSALEDLGLSKGEIRVFLALLELGITKVGRIIEKSGMASSAVHNSLNGLINKGLVSYIKKGKIKLYQAAPPKHLISFIEDKKKRILEALPELELKQRLADERQEAEIFEGAKGLTTMLNIMIEDAHSGEEYLFFPSNIKELNEDIQNFFLSYDAKRKEKGLITKGLAPRSLEKLFKNRKYLKMKYPSYPIPSNMSICRDRIAIFSWGEKPVGYLIRSEQIANAYREFFRQIWRG